MGAIMRRIAWRNDFTDYERELWREQEHRQWRERCLAENPLCFHEDNKLVEMGRAFDYDAIAELRRRDDVRRKGGRL